MRHRNRAPLPPQLPQQPLQRTQSLRQRSSRGRARGLPLRTAPQVSCFLLEKPRVVAVAPQERGYHAFYQMLAGVPPAHKVHGERSRS